MIFGFISSQHQKRAPKELKCKRFDSLGLLHGSPLHIVVDVLGSFQPLAQLGRGVVHVVVRRCPATETEGEERVKGHLTRAAGRRCARTHAWTLFHGAERKVWSDAAEEWVPGLYLTFWLQARDLQHSSNYRLTRRPAASRAVKLPHCLINGLAGAGRGSEGSECKDKERNRWEVLTFRLPTEWAQWRPIYYIISYACN